MDIQRITDYMDAVDIKHCGTNILFCTRKEHGLQEHYEMVRAKRKDFDACILEWCMAHGANAARSLVVYKEDLEKYLKGYRFEKKLFASLINSNGEQLTPLLTSPFDEVPVQIKMPCMPVISHAKLFLFPVPDSLPALQLKWFYGYYSTNNP